MSIQTIAPTTRKLGTRDFLVYVSENLYRHSVTDVYYGQKKIGTKRVTKRLGPPDYPCTDKSLAKGFLREFLAEGEAKEEGTATYTLAMLVDRMLVNRAKMGPGTVVADKSMAARFKRSFPRPMTTPVYKVNTADLKEWLGNAVKKKSGGALRHSTYNRMRLFLSDLFKVAVDVRVITAKVNPYSDDGIPSKKPQDVIRPIPGAGEFERIVAEIRKPTWEPIKGKGKGKNGKGKHGGQRPMSFEESADFVEFMGRVGVGQAEASTITRKDIVGNTLWFTRAKTGKRFSKPIYDEARPVLERRLAAIADQPGDDVRLFTIKNPRKCIANAAKRLGIRHFSARNFRSMHIVQQLANGVDPKQVGKWQGHRDERLIQELYSDVSRSQEAQRIYDEEQLARANGKIVPMRARRSKSSAA